MTHFKLRKLCILLLMTTISIPLFQIKLVQAQSNIPQVIHSCQTDNIFGQTYCSTWRWNGFNYKVFDSKGEQKTGIVMDVERSDKDSVRIYRMSTRPSYYSDFEQIDKREPSYSGNPNGNQIKGGLFVDIGSRTAVWNARW